MTFRLLLLAGVLSAFASAEPITMTFSGVADGELGGAAFSQQQFMLTFTSDTSLVEHPCMNCTDENDWVTPAAIDGTFSIAQVGSLLNVMGVFEDDQAIFANPATNDIGVWHSIPEFDWLAKQDPAFATYMLRSSIGPISTGVNNGLPTFNGKDNSFATTLGAFTLSDVTALTFTADATSTPGATDAVPEPSSSALLSLGIAGLMIGGLRRRRVRA